MKKFLLLLLSIPIFSCISQENTFDYEFTVCRTRLSYFSVWNSTDTSIVAGEYRIENDTVYYIPYTPASYDSIAFENNKFSHHFINPWLKGRKKRKHIEQMVRPMDFINFDYVVYSSIIKFDFDLKQLIGHYVLINGITYSIVFDD